MGADPKVKVGKLKRYREKDELIKKGQFALIEEKKKIEEEKVKKRDEVMNERRGKLPRAKKRAGGRWGGGMS